jgi:hypothetical protein
VRWGGIFLNPAYTPGQQYRLDLVIAHEAARILGVAPSATRNAVLFPSQASQYLGALQLAKDDLSWLEEIYPASGIAASLGSVSGEVINGNDGSKVYGAHVELISLSKVQSFAQSADRKLADVGAFTREDGKFKIPNVPPGDYVMLFETIKNVPLDKSLWDDWIFVNGSSTAFGTEFYSGAQRESNHEPSSSFSPRLIYGAAVLTVQAGQETSNVQIVTEADQLNAPAIVATGSSNEHLVDWPDISDRLKELNQTQDTTSDESAGGGGCSLHVSEALEDPTRGPIIIFVLVLLTLSVWGLRKESYRSEFHRS